MYSRCCGLVCCVVSLRLSLLCFRVSRVGRRGLVCFGYKRRGRGVVLRPSPCVECWCGGVLLSHILSNAVPSPCQVFASGFGMGPGVSPGPWPPQIFDYHPTGSCVHVFPCGGIVAAWGPDGGRVCVLKDRSVMRGVSPRHPSKVIVSFVLPPFVGWCVVLPFDC